MLKVVIYKSCRKTAMNLENFIVWKFSQKTYRCEKSQMGVTNEQFLKENNNSSKKNCKTQIALI